MSLAQPEDAASVLEQFVHDVANIPAEVTHLLEEIQAKDLQIQTFKDEINKRDAQLQKWVRLNGGHMAYPKEDAFSNAISDCYDKCDILQAEKLGLAEKAVIVLERQIKRLDVGLRGLAQAEQFPTDWNGPSLLTQPGGPGPAAATIGSAVDGAADTKSGAAGLPLQVVSGNIPGGHNTTVGAPSAATAAQMRLAQNAGGSTGRNTPSGASTPAAIPRNQREGSSEASSKRRRLNASLGSLPAASSNLRQSSLGPGTPKAGTPGPSGDKANKSRAGSAQPPNQKKSGASAAGSAANTPQPASANRKPAPPQPTRNRDRKRPTGANAAAATTTAPSAGSNTSSSTKKGDRRRQLTTRGDRASPSTNASASVGSASDDEEDSVSSVHANDDGDDETLYCLCQKVSFGDMVGCDNDDCELQWFHYKCVGVTEEPAGEWLCPICRVLPRSKLKISKGE